MDRSLHFPQLRRVGYKVGGNASLKTNSNNRMDVLANFWVNDELTMLTHVPTLLETYPLVLGNINTKTLMVMAFFYFLNEERFLVYLILYCTVCDKKETIREREMCWFVWPILQKATNLGQSQLLKVRRDCKRFFVSSILFKTVIFYLKIYFFSNFIHFGSQHKAWGSQKIGTMI